LSKANRDAEQLRLAANCLCIVLQVAGQSTLASDDQSRELAAGKWTVLRTGEVRALSGTAGTQLIVLQIPRKMLTASTIGVGTLSSADGWRPRTYYDRPLARTLRAFMAKPHPFDAEAAEQVSTLVCRVVEHTIRKHRGADQRRERAFRSQYIKRLNLVQRYVARHLRNPRLQVEDIARHAACTKRYLHKMFAVGANDAGEHQKVGEFILNSRLETIHAELLQRRAQQPLIKIALAHGFNNPSHFARQYRRLFGVTPTTVRRIYRAMREPPSG
jgi:AraC-like DNA-binding protein